MIRATLAVIAILLLVACGKPRSEQEIRRIARSENDALRNEVRSLTRRVKELEARLAQRPRKPTPILGPGLRAPGGRVPEEWAVVVRRGVRELGPGRYKIYRSVINQLLADSKHLAREVAVLPAIVMGQPGGLKLTRLRAGGLLARIGLRDDDIVTKVNGASLASPSKAVELYVNLRTLAELRIEILRAGKAHTITCLLK